MVFLGLVIQPQGTWWRYYPGAGDRVVLLGRDRVMEDHRRMRQGERVRQTDRQTETEW